MVSSSNAQGWNMYEKYRYDNNALPTVSGFAYSDVWGYASGALEVGFIGSVDSIHFFNVSPGISPYQFDSYKPGGRSLWREFKTYKHYAYSIADQPGTTEGMVVLDLSYAPDSVHYVGRNDTSFHRAHMLFVDTLNAHLFIAGSSRNNGAESWDLLMFDLEPDPGHPTLIKKIDLPGNYVHDLYVNNDTAFCSHGYNGFYVYKIDTLGNYTTLGSITSYPEQGYNHSSWMSKNKKNMVWADETGGTSLKLIDVSNPAAIQIKTLFKSALLGPTYTNSIAHNPYYLDSLIIVSYYGDGVQIWDGSNPTNPIKIAYYDTEPNNTNYNNYSGAWGVYPYLPSGQILASDLLNGFFSLGIDFALPLELIDFTVNKNNTRQIKINIEINATAYHGDNIYLEKSTDGKNFKAINQINPAQSKHTIYDDEVDSKNNYYRLLWEENGIKNYSSIKVISMSSYKPPQWTFIGLGRYKLTQASASPIQSIRIYNLDKIVLECETTSTIQLDERIPFGMYLIETKLIDGSSWTQKINHQAN